MKKYLLYAAWFLSILLFISICFTALGIFLFTTNWDIKIYATLLISLAVSVIMFLFLDKKIKKRTFYTKLEGIYFYYRCKHSNVTARHYPLSNTEKELIRKIADETSYFSHFDINELTEIYRIGYNSQKDKDKTK